MDSSRGLGGGYPLYPVHSPFILEAAESALAFYFKGDFLEAIFERNAGYFRETRNDAVMEKVDAEGNILGFSILNVSALKEREPISVSL